MGSAATEDELDEIIKSSLEGPWRLNLIVQFMTFAIVEVIVVALIRSTGITEAAQYTYFIISLAVFFPAIVRAYHRILKSLAYGFYGAAVLVIAYNLVYYFDLQLTRLTDISLYILILLMVSIILLRHIAVEFRVTRSTVVYVFDATVTIIFFVFSLVFFVTVLSDVITGILVSIVLTVIFGYSILPEHIV